MRTPSSQKCRLDLAPPLADRFIFGVAPIDYGPVLLLMPFGFHLAIDTLPSGVPQFPGQREITPAFGYSAPHPSARGTLTLLNNALLSTHYEPLRHPSQPGRSLASCQLIHTAITARTSRVAHGPLCLHAVANTPAGLMEFVRSYDSTNFGLPQNQGGSAPASLFSGPAQRSLRLRPACSPSRLCDPLHT
jgi:hypothetical protein